MNYLQAQSVKQRTLKYSISYVGIGLHSGEKVTMTIKPAEQNSGIVFVRKDIKSADNVIPARWFNVVDTTLSTVLGNSDQVCVSTVEHLMSALYGSGIDNALIEVDGPEIPIMDGSASPFVSLLKQTGMVTQLVNRKAIWIHRPIEIIEDDKYMILYASNSPRITVEIDFPDTAIGSQTFSVPLNGNGFQQHIANARTFGFKADLEQLRSQGLAKGGSVRNAILVDGHEIINEEGLRTETEFVRHKILDVIGDLALVGVPIIGHLIARKPGHKLNNTLLRLLMENPDAWSFTTVDEINNLLGKSKSKLSFTEGLKADRDAECAGIAGTGLSSLKKDHG